MFIFLLILFERQENPILGCKVVSLSEEMADLRGDAAKVVAKLRAAVQKRLLSELLLEVIVLQIEGLSLHDVFEH